jgi:hypothetical protein
MKTKIFFYSIVSFLLISGSLFAQVWDGSTKTIWTAGDGLTAETAYEISTPANLAYLAQEVNAGNTYENTYFKMTTNLDLGSQPWTRIGGANGNFTTKFPFKGVFDGQGYAVSNLFNNRTGNHDLNDKNIGLFGYVEGGVIRNLGVSSGYVCGFTLVGGLVGTLNTGTIDNCFNNASVETARAAGRFGGIVGYMIDGTILNCYNVGGVMQTRGPLNNEIGGIVGYCANGIIQYCFNVGYVAGNNSIAGIAGSSANTNIHDCYNSGTLKGKLNFGGIVGLSANTVSPAIEKCYSNGLMDISEITGSYGAVYGANSDREVNNSFFDVQLITSTTIAKGSARLTSQMLGDGIRSTLGEDDWEYASGFYPALKNNKSSDAAKLSIAPMVLDADDDVDGVISNFTVETSTGVLWSSSDETGIDISGSNAMVLRKQINQNIILTATYGSLSKSYNLFIPLDPSTGVNNVKNQLSVKLNGKVLEIYGDLMNNSKLTIYDLTGTVVVCQNFSNNVIPVANLSKGVYILAAITSDGTTSTHKFLIQ